MKKRPPEETEPNDHVWQVEKLIERGVEKDERLIEYLQAKFPGVRIHVQNVHVAKYPKKVPLIPDADSKEKRYKNVILNTIDLETREIHSVILSVDQKADVTVKWVEKQKWYLKKRYGITTAPRDYVIGGKYDDIIRAFPELQSSDIASMIHSEDEDSNVSPGWISARKYVIRDSLSAPSPRSENCAKFDDIILGGLHNTPSEILGMIHSEDEDADVSYGWVGCRKTQLKYEHGVPPPPREWRPRGRPRLTKKEDAVEPKPEKGSVRKYGARFDKIIISGAEDGLENVEIMSAMLTEDENAPKYVGWLSSRKDYLKKHDLYDENVAKEKRARNEEKFKREGGAELRLHSPRVQFIEKHMDMGREELVKILNEKFTDIKIDNTYVSTIKNKIRKRLGIDGKLGRPPSPRMKYIENHLDTPNGKLYKTLNEKFPDFETTSDYVSLMKTRIRKRLGIEIDETSETSCKPKHTVRRKSKEPSEKRPVKVDYAHKDVLEPEKIVEPQEELDEKPGLESQTLDTYEEKVEEVVEEPTKDYGIPAWKVPLQHEVDVMQPTVGIMRNTYVPSKDTNIITLKTFSVAIKNSIDEMGRAKGYDGVTDDQAREMAQHALNFFGYGDFIIDNVLETEDRDAFYMLQDAGLLKDAREETTLYDGREWRIHYWLLNRERINALAKNYHPANNRAPETVSADEIYSDENTWKIIKEEHGQPGDNQLTGQERDVIYRKKRRGELYVSSQPFANTTS